MPILSVGATSSFRRGVTLVELLIAVSIIGLLAGLTYPSVNAGVDSLRLRSASDQVLGFFSTALDRASRRQQVVEVQVLLEENALLARTADQSFFKRLDIPDPARIVNVAPPLAGSIVPNQARRFLLYPGGAVPAIGVELETAQGRRRVIRLDPLTATARAEPGTQ
jgi:prepilin-type N-terminal cleavage/methylation domain-containing protein